MIAQYFAMITLAAFKVTLRYISLERHDSGKALDVGIVMTKTIAIKCREHIAISKRPLIRSRVRLPSYLVLTCARPSRTVTQSG